MSRSWRWHLLSAGVVLILVVFGAADFVTSNSADSKGKQVTSALEANWAHTSLLAETSEFLTADDPAAFWTFIDTLIAGANAAEREGQLSAEREFEQSIALAAPLLGGADGSSISLLRFALALRLHSPRVELHRQIARDVLRGANRTLGDVKAFYEINGAVGVEAGEELANLLDSAAQRTPSAIYSVDHVHPVSSTSRHFPVVAILYANVGADSSHFAALHSELARYAQEGRARYAFRHFDASIFGEQQPTESSVLPRVSLSGYGVELAIKSTEYKAIDDSNVKSAASEDEPAPQDLHGFNFSALREKHSHLKGELHQFQLHLAELDELSPLKQWEIADIGLQAAQRIMDATPEEALSLLVDLSQNFPIRARKLAQTRVRPSFRGEIVQNQQRWAQQLELGEGESALFLNGIPVASGAEVEQLDLFQLFQTLRQEQRLAEAFAQMGLRRDYGAVLKVMELGEERAGGYALDYREGKPEWMNNLDKDKIYADWGNSVRLLLQPYFPGMIRPIARNLFSLVALIDPGSPASWPLIKIAFTLYSHQVPLRIGFIFAIDDAPGVDGKNNLGVALHNVFQFVKADKGPPKAVHFLKKMIEELTEGGAALELEHVHAYFKRHYTDQEVGDVFGPESDYGAGRGEGIAFFRRSGLQKLPALLVNGVPLDSGLLQSADRIEEGIVMQVMRQTSTLQRAVISGKLTDRENVQNWLMSQPDVLPRLNTRLIGSAEQQQNGGAPKSMVPPFHSSAPCGQSSAEQRTQCMVAQARYLTRADEGAKSGDEPCWSTVWVVADLDSPDGRQLLQNALRTLKKSNEMRLAVVHNGKQQKSGKAAKMVDALLNGFSSTAAKQALNKLLTSEELTAELESNGARPVLDKIAGHGVSAERVVAELNSPNGTLRLMRQWQFAQRELGLAPGQRAVVANGQVFGPLSENEQLELEDFGLLEKLAEKRGAKAVAALVKQWRKNGKKEANGPDTVFRILSAVNAFAVRKRRLEMESELDLESVLNLLADEEGGRPVLEISAVVDPLSRAAQKLAPILQALLRVVNADLRLAMNPKLRLSELPLKRFYRFVLSDEPTFSANGTLLPQIALFRELPQKQLLTMNLQVPDAWMVQPVKAEYDLDNIRVAAASSDIVAHFQLRHILLEGHCFDDQSGNPPRGLQFVLGTPTNPVLYDTIVMANLGYFQLKAGPGAWILRLREGRSRQIYELKNSVDAESIAPGSSTVEEETNVVEELHVLVDSFSGRTIRVRVSKRKGMEKRNLLTEDESGKKTEEEEQMDVEEIGEEAEEEGGDSIWSNLAPKKVVKKLSSKLMGKSGGPAHDRINIFSLASGHLYERFLRIMMLSVLKNTKHPVKFWLLNNCLSPQFRESLPMMAANYGFDYQLIEYKWPRWLHQQTEKQRVMWGYKILFLDVLFPLDVKKIIFVDADQIVRADMMELMEHDLGGAPYGYTPFCDSRTSMDGFRFWKSGYWASHLAGRRYHISALYVVDLVKFRQIAAGDRLRGQYQGLSADPNSLSNLDQDLPNNMIHQVRIHSLPQEWLWCETWCDDVSKKSAKTIDLCNNPQTKEPKLDSAMRIVPEWVDYDNEIKQLLTDVSATSTAGDVKPATIKEEESAEIGEGGEPQHSEL